MKQALLESKHACCSLRQSGSSAMSGAIEGTILLFLENIRYLSKTTCSAWFIMI
jgi:hypothetical protein